MHKSGLYLITNKINGHYYGGSAVDMKHRWIEHKSLARKSNKKTRTKVCVAMKTYGIDNFEIKPLLFCSSDNVLLYEQRWLDRNVGNPECYNMALIAEASFTGMHHSESAKQKISEGLKGRIVSEETRKLISISGQGKNKGHIPWNFGIPLSKSARDKMVNTKSTKVWSFINPDGEQVSFHNLTQFCKNNGLHQGCMIEVHAGKRGRMQHKGWRV